jgi:hypothetical protein
LIESAVALSAIAARAVVRRLAEKLGMPALEMAWPEVAGEDLTDLVPEYVEASIRKGNSNA